MIDYILGVLAVALGLVILIAVGCVVAIVAYTLYQITKRICEGIEKGMNDR